MRNFIQTGDVLNLTAPYAVGSGAGFLVGSLFAVALSAAASGAPVEGKTRGVHMLVKAAGAAWTQGVKLYWDNTAKNVTTASSGNTAIGVASQAHASADVLGAVFVRDT